MTFHTLRPAVADASGTAPAAGWAGCHESTNQLYPPNDAPRTRNARRSEQGDRAPLTCTAPETISAALAVPPSVSTTRGIEGARTGGCELPYVMSWKLRPLMDTMLLPWGTNNAETSTALSSKPPAVTARARDRDRG